jgi:TFIIF-interacting CTD phosphatase-like protein
MQTKFGAKLNILLERSMDLWNGTTSSGSETANIKVKQPIVNQHQPSQADHINTASILPNDRSLTTMPQQQQQQQQQQQGNVDFNNMYADTQTPLENANIPTMEPMAANGMGGGGFSSW